MKQLKIATDKFSILLLASAIVVAVVMITANHIMLDQIKDEAVRQASRQQESSMLVFWELMDRHGRHFHIENGKLILGDYYTLNGDNEMPDKIFAMTGSRATIFQGDTRVATNVMKEDGTRAIGTRLTGPAYDAIFRRGDRYRGEADILGIPYFTAYDPVHDLKGKVIGALFVGVKQSEYLARYDRINLKISAINISLAAIFVICALILGLERRRSENEIKRQLGFQQLLLDTIPSPIFSKDARGHYNLCNKAFQFYVGLSSDRLIGKSAFDLWDRELARKYTDMDREILETTGTQVYESQVRYADGTLHDVIFHKAAVRDDQGNAAGLVGVILDITERKAAEQESRKLEAQMHHSRMIESMMIQLNHDLNTPLTPLFALIPMIRAKVSDPGVERMLEICQQCVNQIQGLAGKALDLVRISSNPPRLIPVSLSAAAESALSELSPALAQRGVICCNAIDPELQVLGSAEQLTLLFKNLLSNAARYAAQNGKVIISALDKGEEVEVSVQDDGTGLDHEQLTRVFDEFYKADTARHDLNTQGLGLAICRRIVTNHEGKLWAASPGAGCGTTMFFTLKRAGNQPPAAHEGALFQESRKESNQI
ncbi:cache domain-containing protein [Geomonas nitrogeniifigens]|uniref:cache domain-containing protein n=1 Tax=Geomonas diazotrophica TaxID=2843197 RepID=UPI001C2C40FB|nr:cache domain-containing protein [Geomonas nitrogeniifigens]QXE85663.1 cache domain-containing protein [Geomonas nitrogeniifigens]